MSKYIQADKLIAEIERQKKHSQEAKMEFIDTGYNQNAFAEDCRLRSFDKLLSFITSLQQEQPEVDLEKFTEKINTFQGRYKYPEIISIKGAMGFMARLFYQYPSVARQWYDSLPKATMD